MKSIFSNCYESTYFLITEKGSVKVFGGDKVAFKGQLVLFECKATGWFPEPTLQWQVNDKEVSATLLDMIISVGFKNNTWLVIINLKLDFS